MAVPSCSSDISPLESGEMGEEGVWRGLGEEGVWGGLGEEEVWGGLREVGEEGESKDEHHVANMRRGKKQ